MDHSHADIATHTEPIAAALTPNAAITKKTIAAVWGFFQYVLDIDILLGSTEHVQYWLEGAERTSMPRFHASTLSP